ncbi:MAG: ABC transporter permease [Candidatus Lokiarchaeota archaeon]|nr:ABC transporter permease [Candidatus Lokiarchaeota archaeon]
MAQEQGFRGGAWVVPSFLRKVWQMTLRNLRNDWKYKFKLLLNSLYTAINLALFTVLAEVVQPNPGALPADYEPGGFLKFLFVGTYFWACFTHPFEDTVQCLPEETQKGTLGLLLTQNISIPVILMGRFWASFIISILLATAVVTPFFFILDMVANIVAALPWIILIMASMTLFMMCVSLWVASFSLLFKKTGVLSNVFIYGLKVSTGMFFPIFGLKGSTLILESVPVASGIDLLRDLFILGQPVAHGTASTVGFGWQETAEHWVGFVLQSQIIGVIALVIIALLCIKVYVKKAKLLGMIEAY